MNDVCLKQDQGLNALADTPRRANNTFEELIF